MNIKYMNMKRIIFFLFAIVLLQSCQKDVSNELNDNKDNQSLYEKASILVINDRLSFKDTTTFNEHLQWIFENQDNPELIKSFNDERNYESMLVVYETGINLESISDFDNYLKTHPNSFYAIDVDGSVFYEMPSPAVLAYIANEDGIFQIGNKICRISYDYYYEITDGDESKIPLLFLPKEDISDNSIFINKTHDESDRGQFSYRTSYFSSKKRIVARLYKNWVGGTANAWYYEARTTSQKKGWTGIWVQRNISEVGVSWNTGYMKYYSWNNPITINAQTHKSTNSSDIWRTIIIAHYSVDNSQSSCLAKHWGKDGSTLRQITNNQIFP